MTKIVCTILLILIGVVSYAQDSFDPPAKQPVITAVESESPITLDGKLLEEIWTKAPRIKDFFRMETLG